MTYEQAMKRTWITPQIAGVIMLHRLERIVTDEKWLREAQEKFYCKLHQT